MSLTRTLGLSFIAGMLPLTSYASFIETTIGTAVVNDATASYYNPAALVLLKQPQIIPQATFAYFHTSFNGQSTPIGGMTQTGSSSTNTNYFSPALYLGAPVKNGVLVGLAIVSNSANRNVEDSSVLRYVEASNNIQDFDVVPAVAIKVNDVFAVGGGINFSYAKFNLQPVFRFPGTNVADGQSNNNSDGRGVGVNVGFLWRINLRTVLGFNYRSLTTYRLSGKSTYEGTPQIVSNNYHYLLRSPARSVVSINHFVSRQLGFIGTVQRIQFSATTNIHINNIATPLGIVNGVVPYYLRDTWVFTLGSIYQYKPEWVVRVAATYNQSPGNPNYQITNGDTIVLGASMGYDINKTITIDGSYAHAFIKNENINITGGRYLISGVNEGSRDAVSLKLTFNV